MFDFDEDEKIDGSEPLLVCWYSGGFPRADGNKLMAPLIEAAKEVGFTNSLVLDLFNEYDIEGEGREPWATYVDKLVEEIDRESPHRPLILLGHSRGAFGAMSVATRLGDRVLKVYIAASGPIKLGEPSGMEVLSIDFKEKPGDLPLLTWFSSLDPDNMMLAEMSKCTEAELQEDLSRSAMMMQKVQLMRRQYKNSMYPDMTKDILVLSVPIMVLCPVRSAAAFDHPDNMGLWRHNTTGEFTMETIEAGHMDCLQDKQKLLDGIVGDMKKFLDAWNAKRW